MSRARAIKAIIEEAGKRGNRVSKATAERVYDDAVSTIDRSAVTLFDQPSRAAGKATSNIRRGGLYVGLGTAGGGVGVGGGLTAREMLRKDQTRMRQATEREKVAMMEDILNDPETSPENKQALIQALADAGVFTEDEETTIMDRLGLGGVGGGSLNPVDMLGGGVGGWVVFLVLVYIVLRFASRGGD